VILHLIPAYRHRRIRSMTADDLVQWHRKQRATKAAAPRRRVLNRRRFVFQSSAPRRPMTYWGALPDLFHDARDRAEVKDVTFHSLRHTFASILIAQGRDVQFVSRHLGHTKTSTTWDTYVHPLEAERHAQDAREQLDAEYDGTLGAAST
jgi:site-specific recombinase XerD